MSPITDEEGLTAKWLKYFFPTGLQTPKQNRDNRMNQKVIKFLLEQQGADCTFAKNGLEAVDLYKILDFDMVFMDI